MSHTFTVPSSLPVTIHFPLAEYARAVTLAVCPSSVATGVLLNEGMSHILLVSGCRVGIHQTSSPNSSVARRGEEELVRADGESVDLFLRLSVERGKWMVGATVPPARGTEMGQDLPIEVEALSGGNKSRSTPPRTVSSGHLASVCAANSVTWSANPARCLQTRRLTPGCTENDAHLGLRLLWLLHLLLGLLGLLRMLRVLLLMRRRGHRAVC